MSQAPKPKASLASLFRSDRGARTAKLSLFQAVFFNRTDEALTIIETDPDQINLQDPFAKLTSLHLAIFRQNYSVVSALAEHPIADFSIKDSFGRLPMDMCIYTDDERIYDAVLERTYRNALLLLKGGDDGPVVPFDFRR